MLIPGHIGFTLGLATLIQKVRRQPTLNLSRLGLYALVALLPDILDRSLNLIFHNYPDHLVFHSFILYGVAIPVAWLLHSRLLIWFGVMAFHCVL